MKTLNLNYKRDIALDLCVAVAKIAYMKLNKDIHTPLTLNINVEAIEKWVREMNRDVAQSLFSDPKILRSAFAYERWDMDLVQF